MLPPPLVEIALTDLTKSPGGKGGGASAPRPPGTDSPVVGTICVQTVLAFFILGKRDAFELRLSHVPMYLFLFFLKSKVAQFVGN